MTIINTQNYNGIFDIVKGDCISIVGSGGKTSLMGFLAKSCGYKTLITTTTKLSSVSEFPIIYGKENIINAKENIIIGAKAKFNGEKIIGFDLDTLKQIADFFDIVFVESDGSKRKPLKGWKSHEPVNPPFSTKTIGVINVNPVGQIIDSSFIHNVCEFCDISSSKDGERLSIEHLKNVIENKNGLFKQSYGEKLIYFSQIESQEAYINAKSIRDLLSKDIKCIAGSVLQSYFEVI